MDEDAHIAIWWGLQILERDNEQVIASRNTIHCLHIALSELSAMVKVPDPV